MGEWRSAALLGHPLTASGIVGAYVLALVLRPAICPPILVRLPLIAFCLGSLMAFGGRTSLVTVLAAIGLVGAFEAFGIMRGKRTPLPAAIVAICVLFVAAAVIFAALNLGIFDKMLLRFSSDKGSALARYATFGLLSHFDWQELILGPNPVRVNALQAQLGLNYGIEKFWIACVVQFGIIHTVLLTIGLVCFFVELLRRSNRAAVGDCTADRRHRRQFGELLVKEHPARAIRDPHFALAAARAHVALHPRTRRAHRVPTKFGMNLGRRLHDDLYRQHSSRTPCHRTRAHHARTVLGRQRLRRCDIVPVTAHGIRQMLTKQNLSLPMSACCLVVDPCVSGLSAQSPAAAVRIARAALYPR